MKRKVWVGMFCCTFIGFSLVEIAPPLHPSVGKLKEILDPIGDVVGIWQGAWDLFAPQVDKENHRIVAEISLIGTDRKINWESPDWKEMNCFEKFRRSREIEFFDRIRAEEKSAALVSLGEFLKRKFEDELGGESHVSQIDLVEQKWQLRMGEPDQFEIIPLVTLTYPSNGEADHKGVE